MPLTLSRTSLVSTCILLLAGPLLTACGPTSRDAKPVTTALPPAPLPQYKIGDEFTFRVGPLDDVQRVVAIDGDIITYESRVFGVMKHSRAFTNMPEWTGSGFTGALKMKTESPMDGIFPLAVGKSVKSRGVNETGGANLPFEVTCTVEESQNIAVTAGRFDTIPVDCVFKHAQGQYHFSYWYAPLVGHWVAVSRNGRYHEMISYKRAQ